MKLGIMVTMLLTMMIVLEFMGIPTGLSNTLGTFGISINPLTHELINADLGNSTFWGWIFGNTGALIVVVGVGAVIVGLFAKSYDTSLVILPLIISVAVLFISTFSGIIVYVQASVSDTWIINLVATIFIAIGVAFIWSCVDYFAQR